MVHCHCRSKQERTRNLTVATSLFLSEAKAAVTVCYRSWADVLHQAKSRKRAHEKNLAAAASLFQSEAKAAAMACCRAWAEASRQSRRRRAQKDKGTARALLSISQGDAWLLKSLFGEWTRALAALRRRRQESSGAEQLKAVVRLIALRGWQSRMERDYARSVAALLRGWKGAQERAKRKREMLATSLRMFGVTNEALLSACMHGWMASLEAQRRATEERRAKELEERCAKLERLGRATFNHREFLMKLQDRILTMECLHSWMSCRATQRLGAPSPVVLQVAEAGTQMSRAPTGSREAVKTELVLRSAAGRPGVSPAPASWHVRPGSAQSAQGSRASPLREGQRFVVSRPASARPASARPPPGGGCRQLAICPPRQPGVGPSGLPPGVSQDAVATAVAVVAAMNGHSLREANDNYIVTAEPSHFGTSPQGQRRELPVQQAVSHAILCEDEYRRLFERNRQEIRDYREGSQVPAIASEPSPAPDSWHWASAGKW